jgi:hypothetical protein
MDTSPEEVNEVGRLEVNAVSEIEKREEFASFILNKVDREPFAPILRENKSPVPTVADPGDQSRLNNPPVLNPVAVEDRLKAVPEVRESALRLNPFVVEAEETTSRVAVGATIPIPTLPVLIHESSPVVPAR